MKTVDDKIKILRREMAHAQIGQMARAIDPPATAAAHSPRQSDVPETGAELSAVARQIATSENLPFDAALLEAARRHPQMARRSMSELSRG